MHKCLTLVERQHLLDISQPSSEVILVIHNTFANRTAPCRRWIIQVSALLDLMVVYGGTMSLMGNGELGSDSGEGA